MANRDNPEIAADARWLEGFAAGVGVAQMKGTATDLARCAERLRRMAEQTCGRGSIGCWGGPTCTSDHK